MLLEWSSGVFLLPHGFIQLVNLTFFVLQPLQIVTLNTFNSLIITLISNVMPVGDFILAGVGRGHLL
jgi:hypothetical protein